LDRAAEQASEQVAEKASEDAAAQAAKKSAAIAAQKASEKIATRAATELAETLGEAAAEASTVVLIPLAILDLMLAAVDMILVPVLHLDADSFEPDQPGEFGFSDLPDWANDILTGIPMIGPIIDILTPVIVIKTGCPDGYDNEANLCYEPAKATGDPNTHYECHGFLCYLHDDNFESQAAASQFADVTKKIIVDTGTVPNTCGAGQVQSGALCYDAVPNATIVAGVAWSNCPAGTTDTGAFCDNTTNSGVGRIPDKGPCDNGQRDDGTSLLGRCCNNRWRVYYGV